LTFTLRAVLLTLQRQLFQIAAVQRVGTILLLTLGHSGTES